jgi:hypothetical protein
MMKTNIPRCGGKFGWLRLAMMLPALMLLFSLNACTPVIAAGPDAPDVFDLLACNGLAAPVGPTQFTAMTRIGLVSPNHAALTAYVAQMAAQRKDVVVCKQSWSAVLPLWTPRSKVATLEKYYGWGAFALALLLTLALASKLTPRHWWTRPTARGMLILGGGCWGGGVVLLLVLNMQLAWPQQYLYADVLSVQSGNAAPQWIEVDGVYGFTRWLAAHQRTGMAQSASTLPLASAPAPAPTLGTRYRVHQALNLRQHAGTNSERVTTLRRGDSVHPTGRSDGDWWQVEARIDGQTSIGWVSSLWLRTKK